MRLGLTYVKNRSKYYERPIGPIHFSDTALAETERWIWDVAGMIMHCYRTASWPMYHGVLYPCPFEKLCKLGDDCYARQRFVIRSQKELHPELV